MANPQRRPHIARSARPRIHACPLCLHETDTLAHTPILPTLCRKHRVLLDCTLLGALLCADIDHRRNEMEARP
jgi:hypothetical protein